MTRFGVMKHLRVLEDAGLVVTRRRGPREAPLPESRADPARPRPLGQQVRRAVGRRPERAQEQNWSDRWKRSSRSTSRRRRSGCGRRSPTPRSGASTNFGATIRSDWTPGSRFEMGNPGAPGLLGEGINLEVDPPRRLVQIDGCPVGRGREERGDLADHLGDRAGRRLLPADRHPRPAPRRRQRAALRRLADDPVRPEDLARDGRAADHARVR